MFDRIRYVITLQRNISDVSSHKYIKATINSYDDLHLEKMHNVIILIKAFFGKNIIIYFYKMFLEKCSYKLTK